MHGLMVCPEFLEMGLGWCGEVIFAGQEESFKSLVSDRAKMGS
jgi:hypothetical protein